MGEITARLAGVGSRGEGGEPPSRSCSARPSRWRGSCSKLDLTPGRREDGLLDRRASSARSATSAIVDIKEWRSINSNAPCLPTHRGHDGRLHTTFNQTVARRTALDLEPNLQAIPVRSDLGARSAPPSSPSGLPAALGRLLAGRLRILAHVSSEPRLGGLRARRGRPRATAAGYSASAGRALEDERDVAKMVNFRIIYGISAFGLAEPQIPREQAQAYIDVPRASARAGLHQAHDEAGRARRLTTARPPPAYRNPRLEPADALARRAARVNSVMQGTAADVIKSRWCGSRRLRREGGHDSSSRCTTSCCRVRRRGDRRRELVREGSSGPTHRPAARGGRRRGGQLGGGEELEPRW